MEPFFCCFTTTTSAELADVDDETVVEAADEVASLRLFALWLEPTRFEAEAAAVEAAAATVVEAVPDVVKALLARPANEELCGKASFGS